MKTLSVQKVNMSEMQGGGGNLISHAQLQSFEIPLGVLKGFHGSWIMKLAQPIKDLVNLLN